MPPGPKPHSLRDSLERLGLTPLEAEVYEFLAGHPASTGYRIAQGLGKPVGMIYKAVESLEGKGAAMTADDGDSRVVRAVPIADFLAGVRRGLEEACAAAERASDGPPEQAPDDRLYRLTSREQVIQRAVAMLDSAAKFAIVNATPGPAEDVREAMAAAAAKGIRVAHKAFAPSVIKGVDTRQDPRGRSAVHSAPGEWLLLTVDGGDLLAALFEHGSGKLHAGYWTQNPLLAWAMFSGLSSDLAMAEVRTRLASGSTVPEIRAGLDVLSVYDAPDSAGKAALVDVYRRPSPARSRRRPDEPRKGKHS